MPLAATKKMLEDARSGGYAVGAFNVENLEMVMAVVAAAEELCAPVILQTTPSTVRYSSLRYLHAMAETAAQSVAVPVAVHLDHGESFNMAMQALRSGYTSVMIDGSHSVFEGNISLTRRVVEAAKPMGVTVEAELGRVGGKEDGTDGAIDSYTSPEQAAEFVGRTGVDSLAVAIGTAHGVYRGAPVLDVGRLSAIAALVKIPLVLHGASGIPEDALRDAISRGIAKVNFATELRMAYSRGVKSVLAKDPDVFDPKKYGKAGMAEVVKVVKEKICFCGSTQKA
jgi:tagatose 1,6-diphosphate aldolase GatY/KbaY